MTRHPRELQLAFTGGEMSPEMYDRVDDVKRRGGAAILRNAVARVTGPVARRPGFEFVGKVRLPAISTPRLFAFVFNTEQSFAILAGRTTTNGGTADERNRGYFRFFNAGEPLLYPVPRDFVAASNTLTVGGNSTATGAGAPHMTDAGAAFPGGNGLAGMILRCNGSYGTILSNTGTTITLSGGWIGGTPAGVSAYEISGIAAATDEVVFGANHAFLLGDPVVLLCAPSSACTFTVSAAGGIFTPTLNGANAVSINQSSPVIFSHNAGSLPPELVALKVYYLRFGISGGIRISLTPEGPPIVISGVGANCTFAVMPGVFDPTSPGGFGLAQSSALLPGTVTYAIPTGVGTRLKLARSKADALAGIAMPFNIAGLGSMRVQFAYEPGQIAHNTAFGFNATVIKRPWGEPERLRLAISTENYLGRPMTNVDYWMPLEGTGGAVTFDTGLDLVQFVAHGYSNGDPVIFSGTTPPAGITFGLNYYVRNKTANDFQVSRTRIGPIIDIGAGAAAVSVNGNSYYDVPHFYGDEELFIFNTAQSQDVVKIASPFRPLAELRRKGNLNWELRDVAFASTIPAPTDLSCGAPKTGFGFEIDNVTTGTPAVVRTLVNHNFAVNEGVYVGGLFASRGLAEDFYRVTAVGANTVTLGLYDSATQAAASSTGAATGWIVSASRVEANLTYVVTSVDQFGAQSVASAPITVRNPLVVAEGAQNPLSWTAVPGAQRYRIYKKELGLFGLIGETTSTTFTDVGIEPDLSLTAPNVDELVRSSPVTFDLTNDVILWANNRLAVGAPVIFDTEVALPTGLEIGKPYFVLNVTPDGNAFQVTDTVGGTIAVPLSGSVTGTAFVKTGFFPAAVCYFEQRLAIGGPLLDPAGVWMSVSGTDAVMTYSVPTVPSDRVQFRCATSPNSEAIVIRHFVPTSQLLLMATSCELRVTPINSDAINAVDLVSVRPQSYVGIGYTAPSLVNGNAIFTAWRGQHVREMGYQMEVSSYSTGDISLRAAHLFDRFNIRQQTYAKAPTPFVWFVSRPNAGNPLAGKLLGLTYVPDEQIGAWHQHVTLGTFESVCAIPDGVEDRLYAVVTRDLGGGNTFMVERLGRQLAPVFANSFHVDSGLTYEGPATTTLSGLERYNGLTVQFLANGIPGTGTVAAGSLTVPAGTTVAHVGLQFVTDIRTLPIALQMPAASWGSQKNPNKVWLSLFESGSFKAGPAPEDVAALPSLAELRPSRKPQPGAAFTGKDEVALGGAWNLEGAIWIRQDLPLPLEVVAATLEIPLGG